MESTGHSGVRRYAAEKLMTFCASVLTRLGVSPADAEEVAACLVTADLRGVDSHGIMRLPVYARRLKAGVVTVQPNIRVELKAASVALVDGDNGLGPVVGVRAMETAIELACTAGLGLVSVRRSNHFGAAAHYVEKAVAANVIGLATSNAPPNMAPWGGRERFLGTNPLAVGIPAGEEPPLIFDMATSVVARGKIMLALQRGEPIPSGWALDPRGHPTTDARAGLAGAMLPFGGAKGSAISFIIDVVCGVLSGASFATRLNTLEDLENEQNLGHLFLAMRTDLFLSAGEFAARMDEILRLLKSSPPAPGVERVLAPGEPEARAAARNREFGVPLTPDVVELLVPLGASVGVSFPESIR